MATKTTSRNASSHGAIATKVSAVRKVFRIRRAEYARVLGLSERRVADLETGKAQPSDAVKRRVTEADRLARELGTVLDKKSIGVWMNEPNPAFGNLKPLEILERGEADRLWRMIYELKSGNHS